MFSLAESLSTVDEFSLKPEFFKQSFHPSGIYLFRNIIRTHTRGTKSKNSTIQFLASVGKKRCRQLVI